jgi:poly-gamma-glutamate system protein
LIVQYFKDLRIEPGDYVALNFSGSFPALNLAVLSAIEVMELNSIIASSVGASTYGANDPDFTYIEMERHLFDEGIISNFTTYVSLGGANDQLLEVQDEAFKQAFLTKFADLGYTVINNPDLSNNIIERYTAYHDNAIAIKAFVNVGGNLVAFGNNTSYYQNGLIKRASVSITKTSGLIERFLRDDIPVVQLLNVEDLALKNNMSVSTSQPFTIGEGNMYHEISYHGYLIYGGIFVCLVFLGYNRYKESKKKRRCSTL